MRRARTYSPRRGPEVLRSDLREAGVGPVMGTCAITYRRAEALRATLFHKGRFIVSIEVDGLIAT
jgi:hypothetical protein